MTLRAMSEFALIMVIFYVCDRTSAVPTAGKVGTGRLGKPQPAHACSMPSPQALPLARGAESTARVRESPRFCRGFAGFWPARARI